MFKFEFHTIIYIILRVTTHINIITISSVNLCLIFYTVCRNLNSFCRERGSGGVLPLKLLYVFVQFIIILTMYHSEH